MRNKKGFTLIELLVVIAIIGLLSTLAVVSLSTARGKARDAKRVADLKQMSTILEMESTQNTDPLAALTGCTTRSLATTCTGPGTVSRFGTDFKDPAGTAICGVGTAGVAGGGACQYTIANSTGGAAPTLQNYEICTWLEQGAGNFTSAGAIKITNGGSMTAGCL